MAPAFAGERTPYSEDGLKAAILVQVIRFVAWPHLHGDTIPVCVVGNDRVFSHLVGAAGGEPVNGRRLLVRRLVKAKDGDNCAVLFVSGAPPQEALEALAHKPVLVVGDEPGFAARGGMLGLVSRMGQISFEVNLDSVQRANLSLSSKFLRLATLVDGNSAGAMTERAR
jgi:hypothetical protein